MGPWLPEPLIGEAAPAKLSSSVSIAFLAVLEHLAPDQRGIPIQYSGKQRAQSAKDTNTPASCDEAAMCRQCNERRLQMNDRESIHTAEQSQMESPMRARAEAEITVQSSEAMAAVEPFSWSVQVANWPRSHLSRVSDPCSVVRDDR